MEMEGVKVGRRNRGRDGVKVGRRKRGREGV